MDQINPGEDFDFLNEPDLHTLRQAWQNLKFNPEMAKNTLLELTSSGSTMAPLYLVAHLKAGNGSSEEIISLYQSAFANGSVYALYRLGIYYSEIGRKLDSLKSLEQAASLSYPPSYAHLAKIYLSSGDSNKLAEAHRLLKLGTQAGQIYSMKELGIEYLKRGSISQKLQGATLLWRAFTSAVSTHFRGGKFKRTMR